VGHAEHPAAADYRGRVQVAYRTEVGHVRSRNEDALLAWPERGLVAVADGLGGHPAGDVASLTAVRSIDESGLDAESSEDDLRAAADAAHHAVLAAAEAEPGRYGMGTTLVVATVRDATARVLHVGDSRAYLLHDGRLEPLTADHGAHGYLTQALGLDREIDPDVADVECPPGSRLLLCTDGLTNMVDDDKVAELLAAEDPQAAVDSLVEAALDAGGIDNVTVVVVAF
jgi:protein phosphatase